MELRLPLEVFPGRQATCRAVFGTWGSFPDDARASHCPFVLTSFTGWSSKRCPGIGFLSRGDREIGVLRNVEPPTRPRLECLRETGLILRCDRKVGNPFQTKQGSRPSCPDQEGRKGIALKADPIKYGFQFINHIPIPSDVATITRHPLQNSVLATRVIPQNVI